MRGSRRVDWRSGLIIRYDGSVPLPYRWSRCTSERGIREVRVVGPRRPCLCRIIVGQRGGPRSGTRIVRKVRVDDGTQRDGVIVDPDSFALCLCLCLFLVLVLVLVLVIPRITRRT